MSVSLTERGEIIAMLRLLYKALPRDPDVYALMEEYKIVHLIDVKASSFDFVIKKAIEELGGQL